VKSPLFLTENLPGGQLPSVLWCCRPSVQKFIKNEEEEEEEEELMTLRIECFRGQAR
jgi:hypothetical protein